MASIIRSVPGQPTLNNEATSDTRATLNLIQDIRVDDIQIIPDDASSAAGEIGAGGQSGRARQQPVAVPVSPEPESILHKRAVHGSALRRHLTVGDVIALVAAWGSQLFFPSSDGRLRVAAFAGAAVMVTLVAMNRAGLYRSRVCALRSLEAVRVFTSSVIGTSAFIACEAIAGPVKVEGPVVAGAVATMAVLLLRWRFSRWLKARRSVSKFLRTVVLVGTNDDAEGLWALLSEEPELGYRVGAVVGENHSGAPWAGLASCVEIEGVGEIARRAGANGIIVVASALGPMDRYRVVNLAQDAGLHVQIWPGLYGFSSRRTRMVPVSGIPLLYVEPKRAFKWELGAKRAMDLVLAVTMGLLSAPILGVAALAVKMADGGPIIHRSKRVGRHGVTIDVMKLRTMVPDASKMMLNVAELNERKGGPLFKATDDPRVTKIGRILRATSVDEIPQLWNVLNGTMSLVGPRPALLHEVEHFDDELRRRHQMRPGITGLWQVEARDNPSFSAYRRLDLSYVDDWSLGLDVAILASTVHEMIVRGLKAFLALVPGRSAPSTVPEEALSDIRPQAELGTQQA